MSENFNCSFDMTIKKKIINNSEGNPYEVIISNTDFRKIEEMLGLDLTNKEKSILRNAKKDRKNNDFSNYIKESEIDV